MTDVDPGALCLEVAEDALGEDPEAAIAALRSLKAIGVRLAIDDFGSGAARSPTCASSRSTCSRSTRTSSRARRAAEDAAIVSALVELGHALGLGVVAEGVETDAQLAQLRELGCDGAQGSLFGRP